MILIGASAVIFMSSYWLYFWSTILPHEEQDTMRNGATLLESGRCLTADNLAKCSWPHDLACPLCSYEQEDCDHLFPKCSFTNRDDKAFPAGAVATGETLFSDMLHECF
uniref:Reverse transcriptase zinc-binding domain-containing protein n=1 Tax=Oryza glumipatula TaxID=40148 RepID=A0A0D9YMD4_9ORYZ